MRRPDEGAMRALPVLEARRPELETCVYCPKLSRAACPVSNAEPNEALTPWGKMSTVFFQARGDAPLDEGHAATAWACSGCYGCRERCDHRNEVAGTLLAARSELAARGLAPPGAQAVLDRQPALEDQLREATARLAAREGAAGGAALLLGCGYVRKLPDEAAAAVRAAQALLGPVRLLERCCGLPRRLAGDEAGFLRSAEAIAREAGGEVTVVDPGCALALRGAGVAVRLLVEVAAADLGKFHTVEAPAPLRYHDPCQLGRGLGVYEAPRALLARITGTPPQEFAEARGGAACSGAGGVLPSTMPAVSEAIAGARVARHEAAGGGEIVTACASSLRAFRKAGARASDLNTWLARGLGR